MRLGRLCRKCGETQRFQFLANPMALVLVQRPVAEFFLKEALVIGEWYTLK